MEWLKLTSITEQAYEWVCLRLHYFYTGMSLLDVILQLTHLLLLSSLPTVASAELVEPCN